MRHFYIFNINSILFKLTKESPDILFNTFDYIYHMKSKDLNYGMYIYNNIIKPLNKNIISNTIYSEYKDDLYYIKFMNTHLYNNYFNKENTKLTINNSYLKLDSTSIKPSILKTLYKYKNLFVCDFENKDYFWLESIA